MSFKYISRMASFGARVVMMNDTQISSALRRHDFCRASCSVMPGNILGRNTLRATCWVIVLAPPVVALFAANVRDHRADHADRIEAGVLVEAAILDREHRLLHARRDRRQRHRPPLLPLAATERGQHRRVERDPLARLVVELEPLHAIGHARRRRFLAFGHRLRIGRTLKHDADRVSLQLGDARHDRDRALADRELAGLLQPIAMGVAELVEPIDQLLLGHRLAAAQLERPRQHAREHRRSLAVQARVDQPREAHVVVAGDDAEEEGGDGERDGTDPNPAFPPEPDDADAIACGV